MPASICDRRERRSIKDFALVREVGSGAVSSVYCAFCRKSSLQIAIKVYNKAKLTKLNCRQVLRVNGLGRPACACAAHLRPCLISFFACMQVEREIAIHSSLRHPHIVDFVSCLCSRVVMAKVHGLLCLFLLPLPRLPDAVHRPQLPQYAAFEDDHGIYMLLEYAEGVSASHSLDPLPHNLPNPPATSPLAPLALTPPLPSPPLLG
jgi:serine/threonine protein kinase